MNIKVGDKVEWRPNRHDMDWMGNGVFNHPQIGVRGTVEKVFRCSGCSDFPGGIVRVYFEGFGSNAFPSDYCRVIAVTKDSRCDGCDGRCNCDPDKDDCDKCDCKDNTAEIDVREYCVHKWVPYYGMNSISPQFEYCEKCGEKK